MYFCYKRNFIFLADLSSLGNWFESFFVCNPNDRLCRALNPYINVYVQRKMRIGTIPELYLRKVRILTLSADSGIVPDNSRMAQRYFIDFRLGPGLAQSRNWLDKVGMASGIK